MFESKENKGKSGGYPPLDAGVKIPLKYLPESAPIRFGIEDNLSLQDRAVNFNNHNFQISNLNKLFIGSGNLDANTNTVGQFVSDFSVYSNAIDIQSYSGNYSDLCDVYVFRNGVSIYSSRGTGVGTTGNAYSSVIVHPEVINTSQVVNGVGSNLMFPFLDTSARAATYLTLSVNGNYADAAGNITIAVANPVIPFYKNNTDAIANGAVQGSMYKLPYVSSGDYYPLALVGPGLQTFALTMADNCNISTLSANVLMRNTVSNTTYNFIVTRASLGTSFNPITITVLQGPYEFSLSNV